MPRPLPEATRDAACLLEQALSAWGGQEDLWVFGYASLIWRPEFEFSERRPARLHGYHRALKMWSRVNRGSPECPGLVCALLSGGSCQGMVFRIPQALGEAVLRQLWPREMPNPVYDPKWLRCNTNHPGIEGDAPEDVRALAFTLSRHSPNFTGNLSAERYRQIFSEACGRYGTTLEYAQLTLDHLQACGIRDQALAQLLHYA